MPDVTDLCEDMEVMTEIPALPPSSPVNMFPPVSPMTSFHPSVSPTCPPHSPLAPPGGEASEALSSHSSNDDSKCGSAGARWLNDKNSKCSDGDTRQEEGKIAEESDDRCSAADEAENYIDVIGDTDCSDAEMTDDHKSRQVDDSSKTSGDDDDNNNNNNNNNHHQHHNVGNTRCSRSEEGYRSNDHIISDDSVNDRDDEQNVSPLSHTNFSIAAILKPDFGVRKGGVSSRCAVGRNSHSPDYFHTHSQQRLNNHSSSFHLFGHRHDHSNDNSTHHHHHHHAHSHRYHQHHPLQRHNSPSPVDLTTRGRGEVLREKDKTRNSDSREVSNSNRQHSKNNSKDNNNRNVNNKNIKDANSSGGARHGANAKGDGEKFNLWPAWVFCTRYSDRPSSGPRLRKIKRRERSAEEKRPRTAFTNEQLARLKKEFDDCRYLTENRRRHLATDLGLTEAQIKIWFQNKRAKIKKSSGLRNPLALQLMAQGLYNHSTVTVDNPDGDIRGTDAVEEIVVS